MNFEDFEIGQRVRVKPDAKIGECVVESIEMLDKPIQVLSRTVVGYIRVSNDEVSGLGYHPESLEIL